MKKLLAFSLLAIAATAANADAAWFQYSIASPGDLLLPWNRSDVYGLRLDMPYGNNKGSVIGVDLGVVGIADEDAIGIAATAVNVVDLGAAEGLQIGFLANRTKELYGVQLGGVLNWNEDLSYGLQIGAINYDGEFYGVQIGAVNWFVGNAYGVSIGAFLLSNNSFKGFSAACLNYEMHKMSGLHLGGINLAAESSTGLQLGLVNISKHHEGLQLGLININSSGFLPCFPIVNFNFSR